MSAIADRVIKACKAAGVSAPRVEGLPQCDWVLVDAGDVIVHIFRPEVRQFYNLEKMWATTSQFSSPPELHHLDAPPRPRFFLEADLLALANPCDLRHFGF